jgi:plastocyanin
MKKVMKALAVGMCLMLYAVCSVQAQTAAKVVPEKKVEGHQVVQINRYFALDPKLSMVKPGTTVIWMNLSESNVEIQFTGKAVALACKSPTHFIVDEEGSFVSDRIPPSAVASLCFIEKGTYNYVLHRGPRATAAVKTDLPDVNGTIIVE